MRLVCLLFFSFTYLATSASKLDSLVQIKNSCLEPTSCYEALLDICEVSITEKDKSTFNSYVPELVTTMQSIDQNEVWVDGLVTISEAYRLFNELEKADSTLQIAQSFCNSSEQLFNVYTEKARLKHRMGQPKEALSLLEAIQNQLGPDDPLIEHHNFYMLRARYELECKKTADAIKDFIKVKEMTKDIPEYKAIHDDAELYLSETYLYLMSYDSLQVLHHNTREQAREKKDHVGVLFATYPIILSAIQQENYEEAIKEGHQAIKLKNDHNALTAFGFIYSCMAEAFMAMNQLDSAAYYVEKGISFSRKSCEDKELADNLSTKADLLIRLKKYQEAKLVVEEALSLRGYHDEYLLDRYALIQENLGEYVGAYESLRSNWDHWKESDALEEARKVSSLLLEERMKLEKQQQGQQFQSKLNLQKLWTAITLLALLICVIGTYFYMQLKNNKKLKQLNQSLTQHNQALEQFAYITSHDLKEPVNNISSFTELLLKKSRTDKYDADEKKYITFINTGAKNLSRMLDSIKKFTDVSFSKHESEILSVNEVIETVKLNLSQLINKNNASVEFHNVQSISAVRYPKQLLILILQNLIQNGIKYNNSQNPHIDVTISSKNNKTIFKVSDNGIGIGEKFQEQIFTPFKTLHSKADSKSSGLGLTICKNIIENHGGEIWVESDGNSGSSFFFSI